ncbi:MAG: right-handed parallel beta-helix repeat-containing protein [Bacteroidota bacterium]
MRTSAFLLSSLFLLQITSATTLHIGSGYPYNNFEEAAAIAQPGDTILFHEGVFPGGQFVANLQGAPDQWIYVKNAPNETAILEGGTNAIQLSDPAYLHISGLIFQQQTGNGFNTDDAGNYDTPAHHIVFENCIFRDMGADGNNDLLKLSGLNDFQIINCTFLNGAAGGSGIDMVGCHHGIIKGNYFENMGSNSIQAKGGTQHILIEGNFFQNGGQRTLNLGGSTGLPFFRPVDATFEAADIQVFSNIIVGSWAAVAYVGSINVEVVNNTIYQPQNWVIRILQESVDADRFVECGDNIFRNNIVFLGNSLSTETNVGPNTRPETFTFSNNLWYNTDDENWSGPNIPVEDVNGIINEDPMFVDPSNNDFLLAMNSPAVGNGFEAGDPEFDFYEMGFNTPRSIGAIEADPIAADFELPSQIAAFDIFPNPGDYFLTTTFILEKTAEVKVELIAQNGQRKLLMKPEVLGAGVFEKTFEVAVPAGWYLIRMWANEESKVESWMRVEARP